MDNKSCIFISLKYTLIALLLVDLINSFIAGTAIIAEIDSPSSVSEKADITTTTTTTTTTTSAPQIEAQNVTEKAPLAENSPAPIPLNSTEAPIPTKKLITHVIFNVSIVFFTIMGLVGVSMENFYLSLLTACVMVTEGTLAFFVTLRSDPNVLTIVFNLIIAVLAVIYAVMIKLVRDTLIINRVEPISSTRDRLNTPPVMATQLNGSAG